MKMGRRLGRRLRVAGYPSSTVDKMGTKINIALVWDGTFAWLD